MKAERNHPCAGERSEVLARAARAQTDVTVFFFDKHFDFGRRNNSPAWIAALRRHKTHPLRNGIKLPHRRSRREIGREKPKVKTGTAFHRRCQRTLERRFIWATPVEAVMQQRDRRMKFRQDPSIFATRARVRGSGFEL